MSDYKIPKATLQRVDQDCLTMKRTLTKAAKNVRGNPHNQHFRAHFFDTKKKYKKIIRCAKSKYECETLGRVSNIKEVSSNEFWKNANILRKPKDTSLSKIPPEEVFEYFSNLLKDRQPATVLDIFSRSVEVGPLDFEISEDELYLVIRLLKWKKSTGPDRISNEILDILYDVFPNLILRIFNNILVKGVYPKEWSISYLVPIHKKDSKLDIQNYRGICLMSCFGKLFSKIMNFRLVNWLTEKKILPEEQLGFVRGNRTTDAHIMLYNLIEKYCKKKNKRLYTCFVDFEKAFDKISRTKLLTKLKDLGITGKFLNIIAAMYTDDQVKIKVGNKVTKSIYVTSGVRQGCVLSPTLFNIFLADFMAIIKGREGTDVAHISNSETLGAIFWADDIMLVSESAKGLQNQLNCLAEYSKMNALTINVGKTKSVCFNKSGKLIRSSMTIENKPVEDVKTFKYLGFVFSCGGSIKPGLADLKDRGQKAFYALKRSLGYSFMKYPEVTIILYNAIVKQILLYASDFWGAIETKNSPIESMHLQFCRHLLGLSKKASINASLMEVGFYPLHIEAKMRVLRNWLRISREDCNELLQKFFTSEDINDCTWKYNVGAILQKYGFGFIVNAEEDTKTSFIDKKFEQILRNKFYDEAVGSMSSPASKMVLYACLVEKDRPKYVSKVPSVTNRILFSKMRVGDHDLQIQKGRYSNTPRSERYCQHCVNQVEDECHFLLHCSLYEDVRQERDAGVISICPEYSAFSDFEKLKYLLKGDSERIIELTSAFLGKSTDIKNNFLELLQILVDGIG